MRQDLRQTISEIILPLLISISQVLSLQHCPEIKYVTRKPLKFFSQVLVTQPAQSHPIKMSRVPTPQDGEEDTLRADIVYTKLQQQMKVDRELTNMLVNDLKNELLDALRNSATPQNLDLENSALKG